MLIRQRDFPVRVSMRPGESLAGYVCRFQGTNGHWVPRAMHEALRAIYGGAPEDAAAAWHVVEAVFEELISVDHEFWSERRYVQARGRLVPSPALSYTKVQLCSACIAGSGYHSLLWELPEVRACPIHKIALRANCEACGRGFTWPDMAPGWSCRCGAKIAEMNPPPLRTGWVALAQLIAGASNVPTPAEIRRKLNAGSYQLRDVANALEWANSLRSALKRHWQPVGTPELSDLPVPGKSRSRTWEARLFTGSTIELDERLLKVIAWRFRRHPSPIVFLVANDYLPNVITSVQCGPEEENPLCRHVQSRVGALRQRHQLSVSNRIFALRDPQPGPARQSDELEGFGRWWSDFVEHLEDVRPEAQLPRLNKGDKSTLFGLRYQETQAIAVLDVFFKAARQNISSARFDLLTHWWRIPERLRADGSGEDILRRLCEHLLEMPASELAFVGDLVFTSARGLDL